MEGKVDFELAQRLLAPPTASDSKYSRGSLGFITGSEKYPGAALLGINAAFELGIGMVSYLGPRAVTDLVLSQRPEVIPGIHRASALVMGSGVDPDNSEDQVSGILEHAYGSLPMVIDAGALFIVDFEKLHSRTILTPHIPEAQRLLKRLGVDPTKQDISASPKEVALQLASLTKSIVLLKGNTTYIASPSGSVYISGPGSTHLATAGTGDVLSGMLGALLAKSVAQSLPLDELHLIQICLLANQIHSIAADLAAARGEFGASRVSNAISEAVSAWQA